MTTVITGQRADECYVPFFDLEHQLRIEVRHTRIIDLSGDSVCIVKRVGRPPCSLSCVLRHWARRRLWPLHVDVREVSCYPWGRWRRHRRVSGDVSLVGLLVLCIDAKRRRRRRRRVDSEGRVVCFPGRNALGWRDVALIHQAEHVVFPPFLGPDIIADVRGTAAATGTTLVHGLPRHGEDEGRGSGLPELVRRLGEEMEHRSCHDGV